MPKDRYEDQDLDGRYHLLRLLDAGNFGAVYEARDSKLGRTVAVKILFEKDETAFRKEAKLAVQFDHPNVVKVYDYGSDEKLNVGFIVMEFLKGRRLDQLITSYRGRVPDAVIVRLVDQIGGALQLAHERQLIHRDLKPGNVMLVDENTPQERFVLLDLGLASQMNATSTLRNQTLDGALSPQYASPEQFGQGSVDFRSDIYSFGTILFELFTGETPFVRDQLLSLMMAICGEPSPSFRDTAPDREVPPEVEEIVQHCLAKQPGARPNSIRIVRSRILTAFGADTVQPVPRRQTVAQGDTVQSGSTIPAPVSRHTGTMLPPSNDGSQSTELEQAARSNVVRTPYSRPGLRRTPSRAWQRIAMTLLILLPLSLLAVAVFWKRPTSPLEPRVGKMIASSALQLESGGSDRIQVYVEPPGVIKPNDAGLLLKVTEIPVWLHVEVPETLPVSQTIELIVTADPVVEALEGDITLVARVGDWTEKKTVHVSVRAPEIWKLPDGFEPLSGTDIVRSGENGLAFYHRIARVVDADLKVNFVLIDAPRSSSGAGNAISPFYIMEHKVWNELFSRYWQTAGQSDPQASRDSEWMKGAIAAGRDMGVESQPKLPTVRVTALEAHRFAVWLGGQQACHLPSIDQWNVASGLKHRATQPDDQKALYPEGPFRGVWKVGETDVAVNRGQSGPKPVGESRDDVAPTGCTDMAGNVLELTENLMNGARVGDVDPQQDGGALLRVVLRGRSYFSESPLRWVDIQGLADIPDAVGYNEGDPTIGFRVVLETAR